MSLLVITAPPPQKKLMIMCDFWVQVLVFSIKLKSLWAEGSHPNISTRQTLTMPKRKGVSFGDLVCWIGQYLWLLCHNNKRGYEFAGRTTVQSQVDMIRVSKPVFRA